MSRTAQMPPADFSKEKLAMSWESTAGLLDEELDLCSEDSFDFDDVSPFGLQGLARKRIRVLKPESITPFAVNLALSASRKQIQDPKFVIDQLNQQPEWFDEYRIVHLIEKSLWIQGHCDLVMTLTKNPKQIPDNPPAKIKQALANCRMHHGYATIWYGVPLFSDAQNADGLPIPVTADEVRQEARRRIRATQEHALRWFWYFRAAMAFTSIPVFCWRFTVGIKRRIQSFCVGFAQYWKRCQEDVRRRDRARYTAEWEYGRYGWATTQVPEHTTWLGRTLETAAVIFELIALEAQITGVVSPLLGAVATPLIFAKFAPLIFVPITVMSCDPFLFVELREEPGKLRHIGHWYWQKQEGARDKLHLHV